VFHTNLKAELLSPPYATSNKPTIMTSPHDDMKEYKELYHSFTEAYINVHSITRDFYPVAKKFVEHTEPELSGYVEKGSYTPQQNQIAYQKLVQCINHFDDFTISANKLFGDLKTVLHKSDNFMTRVLDQKISADKAGSATPPQFYTALIPELNLLIACLKQIPERAANLEEKMKQLELDWKKNKEKIQ
jgi:hypothetical protein